MLKPKAVVAAAVEEVLVVAEAVADGAGDNRKETGKLISIIS